MLANSNQKSIVIEAVGMSGRGPRIVGAEAPEVALRVEAYTRRLRRAFRTALIRARTLGQVAEEANADEMARYLTGVVVGASVYARTPGGGEAVQSFLAVAARALRG